ncbi:small acid-soluble spore protein SspI [Lysinibacillus sphaericus]|uniref:Small, acid-soluble spore protein I n=3 Tax=Lysinibacillus TaxID=400634 RepID=A0A2S5CX49_LYSSH|nr:MULTISPECIES: small acid-soluble spore protein SspI [Lysinibacillus]AHN22840.1 spore protein [Lysinibacillus varians]AVK95944.1 small acid-soluble spore protein SspI [Lysinibacillus sphaericus]MCS1380721.1 small acid-soluble spore protein SspI [Lysinibacillus sphaericus]MED4545021.1 small acid-soluble spore protein SspI [Lysinibacillus sphaericus]OEC00171.1 spore protein [Lysinibacillus sphaericus]
MNFQIRDAISANVHGQSAAEFKDIVQDAISRGEEHLLPGLGVFFEKWWQQSTAEEQDAFVQKLEKVFAH